MKSNKNLATYNYKNSDFLRKYTTAQGKILSRRITHLSAKEHRQITKAIKQARILGLLIFTPIN